MLTHTIAAVALELAYLATGILLCYMGRKLLELGVESKTRLEGEIHGNKWVLLTSSPGIVFALCGLGIIIYAIAIPSEYEETLKRTGAPEQVAQLSTPAGIEQTVSSRLFGETSATAGLSTRLAIYTLQHRERELPEEDIDSVLAQVPGRSDMEPWFRTYDQLVTALRKNPSALRTFLLQPHNAWIVDRDRQDGSLSARIDVELERLSTIN